MCHDLNYFTTTSVCHGMQIKPACLNNAARITFTASQFWHILREIKRLFASKDIFKGKNI